MVKIVKTGDGPECCGLDDEDGENGDGQECCPGVDISGDQGRAARQMRCRESSQVVSMKRIKILFNEEE